MNLDEPQKIKSLKKNPRQHLRLIQGMQSESTSSNQSTSSILIEARGSLDKTGITLSALCAVHCFVFPLLALFMPVFRTVMEQEWFHWIMALVIVPLGIWAFLHGFWHHRSKRVLVSGFTGLTLVTIGLFIHDHVHEVHSNEAWSNPFDSQLIISFMGSLFLIYAHVENMRKNRQHKCCHRY